MPRFMSYIFWRSCWKLLESIIFCPGGTEELLPKEFETNSSLGANISRPLCRFMVIYQHSRYQLQHLCHCAICTTPNLIFCQCHFDNLQLTHEVDI